MSRGIRRERQTRDLLREQGWWVARAAGSLGDADLIALKHHQTPRLIEVKSTAGGPYERFGPDARGRLIGAARLAGAQAWLAWWPANKPLHWIPEGDWPGA
jgi:Holliday junction resolvase